MRSKSSRSTSRTIAAVNDDGMTDDICFADAPVDSIMIEDFRGDILTPPICDEGDDDDNLIPLHLLWDPTESADLTTGFKFSYDPAVSPHELEDDGDGGDDGVNDADEEDIDTFDFSGE
jgi:hypothetical protein